MMAVDTSALMAILLKETAAEACIAALQAEAELVISATTLAEALIVATRRGMGEEMERLINALGLKIVSVTADFARQAARAYARWGEGVHPAALNFCDCFAYVVAKERDCRLLFVGDDFPRTDIKAAIS